MSEKHPDELIQYDTKAGDQYGVRERDGVVSLEIVRPAHTELGTPRGNAREIRLTLTTDEAVSLARMLEAVSE